MSILSCLYIECYTSPKTFQSGPGSLSPTETRPFCMGLFARALSSLEATVYFGTIFLLIFFQELGKILSRFFYKFDPKEVDKKGSSDTKLSTFRKKKVGVIGGGIAGHGCAYTLSGSPGFEVHLFEDREDFGGNAKTFQWPDGILTGLSVLAWPPAYFRNYRALLKRLNVPWVPVKLPFCIKGPGGGYFAHGLKLGLSDKFNEDIQRWKRLVALVRKVNVFFAGTDVVSLYHMSYFNPMNVISLRSFSKYIFGISDDFWEQIVVPLYASSFLTIRLDEIPAFIVPVLDDLIPLEHEPEMQSWKNASSDVFDSMAKQFTRHGGEAIVSCRRDSETQLWNLYGASGSVYEDFDNIVFASNAHHAAKAIEGSSKLEQMILGGVEYTNEHDDSFEVGIIHSDPSILPTEYRGLLSESYANYIEARTEGSQLKFENTFILSSWYNTAKNHPSAAIRDIPRFVTYGSPNPDKIKNKVGEVANYKNHPHLHLSGLVLAMCARFIQGNRGVYYCGSYATPANGHDLSFCSGIAVAVQIGAKYPFPEDKEAEMDFKRLTRIMGL